MKGFPVFMIGDSHRTKSSALKKVFIYLIFLAMLLPACDRHDDPPSTSGKVIILMYHRIVEGEPENLYERSRADFESDLIFLKMNNIKVISFDELYEIMRMGKMPPQNCTIITFDDGDHSWYSLARPLLMKYNMKATFFLWVYMIGSNSFLTWTEIEHMGNYMLDGGTRPFTFGSHTYSHPFLLGRKSGFATDAEYNSFLNYEMGVSKSIIEEHIPGPVEILALPYGDGYGDQTIITAAERNGYRFIRTSKYGVIDNTDINLLMLPSLPILDDTPSELIGDWLGL